jgi:hypothetical protein
LEAEDSVDAKTQNFRKRRVAKETDLWTLGRYACDAVESFLSRLFPFAIQSGVFWWQHSLALRDAFAELHRTISLEITKLVSAQEKQRMFSYTFSAIRIGNV